MSYYYYPGVATKTKQRKEKEDETEKHTQAKKLPHWKNDSPKSNVNKCNKIVKSKVKLFAQ